MGSTVKGGKWMVQRRHGVDGEGEGAQPFSVYWLVLQTTSERELLSYGLSQQLIDELVTVIMRINYGQSKSISGMAGAVSLCGSGDIFWAVEGGNWQMAAGLVDLSNASLQLDGKVSSVMAIDGGYEVGITAGDARFCNAVIVATSLDESPD
ncbi:hypothetical protein L7F22_014213 [Adiantum nelumboides]|nr:hypothetical protein [Adiantum nelumboides]